MSHNSISKAWVPNPNHNFTYLDNIDPVLDAIQELDGIHVIKDYPNDLGIVCYKIDFGMIFLDPYENGITEEESRRRWTVREARGIKYSLSTGEILSRPYHKFFNLGERSFTQLNFVDWSKDHLVLTKMDGSCLTPLVRDDSVRLMTKRGLTDIIDPAKVFLEDERYIKFFEFAHMKGFTPCMEWCSRKNIIILDYPEDVLAITAIRHNKTGGYIDYYNLEQIAQDFEIPLVPLVSRNISDIGKFVTEVRGMRNIEGFVIRFSDDMYKIKTEWYDALHKTKDGLRFEKDIWRMIFSGTLDDALPYCEETFRASLKEFQADIGKATTKLIDEIKELVDSNRHLTQKEFVPVVMSHPKIKIVQTQAFDYFKNPERTDLMEELTKFVLKNIFTVATVINRLQPAFGVKWNDYSGSKVEFLDD